MNLTRLGGWKLLCLRKFCKSISSSELLESGLFIRVFSTPTETGGAIGARGLKSASDESDDGEFELWMAFNTEFTLEAL